MGDKIYLLKHAQHMTRAKYHMPPRDPNGLAAVVYTATVWLSMVVRSASRKKISRA